MTATAAEQAKSATGSERTAGQRRKSRIRLRSDDRNAVLAIGALTGAALIVLGLRPTASVPVDVVLAVGVSMFVAWAGCTAPWYLITIAAMTATTIAPFWLGTVVGVAAILASAAIGLRRRSQPVARAGVIGTVLALLAVARPVGGLGASALVGVVVVVGLAVTGLRRRPSADRRLGIRISLGAAAVVVVALVGLGFALASARSDIELGSNQTREGLRLLQSGDIDGARERLNQAEGAFQSAEGAANAPWGQLARVVPVAAQYRVAATSLTSSAHSVASVASDTMRSIDPSSLRMIGGRIDVQAVLAMRAPIERLQDTVADFNADLGAARSVWLPAAVDRRLDALAADVDEQQQLGTKLLDWIDVAPELLGADGPRTYFVMFTTPAEARGQGGFMGNFAELTITDGQIAMTRFGRSLDLNTGLPDDYVLTDAPADWMQRFGPYGFRLGSDGVVARRAWSIIDLSAHFPSTAKVISTMYPASGGNELDGVFSLDVYGIEALVGLVGPVEVEGGPTLTGDNTAEYLLLGQYEGLGEGTTNTDRVDMLERVADATIARLLGPNPPDPIAFGKAFAPLAKQGRVLAWSRVDAVEELFERVNVDGRVLDDDTLAKSPNRVGVQLVVNNGAGNKIDSFLERTTQYDQPTHTVTVTYTNTAPTSGYPDYVIGSAPQVDVPIGTAVLLGTLYSSVEVDDIRLDGQSVLSDPATEADRLAYEFRMTIPSGASARVEVVLPADAGEAVVVDQPLVQQIPG